jgi:hypothetical protein
MKYLLLPFALLFFSFVDERKQPESPGLPWQIISSVAHPSVQANESLLEFRFLIDGSKAIQKNIVYSYNSIQDTAICSQEGILELFVKAGKYKFQFFLDQSHYEVITDSINCKAEFKTVMQIDFRNSEILIEVDKPVIYLYPETTMNVSVNLNFSGKLGFTWPLYNNGWNVEADRDGTIRTNGSTFDYLFWEGNATVNQNMYARESGFIVHSDTLDSFFENTLTQMNLNPRERQDFITYWCPRMMKNELNFIHFSTESEYNQIASMNIDPQPQEIFRVFMMWNNTDVDTSPYIHEQSLPRAERKGFTVIEWGGAEITNDNP